MFGLAVFYQVPFRDIAEYEIEKDELVKGPAWQNEYYTIPVLHKKSSKNFRDRFDLKLSSKNSNTKEKISFSLLCQQTLEQAKAGKVHPTLTTDSFRRAVKPYFVHHSADCITLLGTESDSFDLITVNAANKNLKRDVYECEPGQ